MKRLIIIMLVVVNALAVIFPGCAITSAEKESNYAAAILQLETYIENNGNSSAELAWIESANFGLQAAHARSFSRTFTEK